MNSLIENLSSEAARRILFAAKESGVSVENYLESIANGSNGDAPEIRKASETVDLSKSRAWLKENRQKFLGNGLF